MKFHYILIALILLARPQLLQAHSVEKDTEVYEKKLGKGIEAFYQTDWEKASVIFEELKEEDEKDPRAYFFDSMIPFWEYFFAGSSSKAAEQFLSRSEKALEISYNRLKENPHDTTMVLMLSGLYGYRSLVAASESNYQTALQSGMTGFKYTRQLLALDADDPKALIGKGIFYYMAGSVPKQLRWMTNMMGISGDMEEGLAILEKAAESDSYVSNDAKMILAYLYEREKRYKKAFGHIQDLCKRYDRNVIFQFKYAHLLELFDRQPEARQAYKSIVQNRGSSLSGLRQLSKNRLLQL